MVFPGRWREETSETFRTHAASKGDTVVGNDVWFGRDVTVLPGVRIGDGAIIGTAAVVTRDVAPYTVVGGNPAQLIKQRYSDAEVALLQRASWWDWPIEVIGAHHHPDGRHPGRDRRHRPPARAISPQRVIAAAARENVVV